MKVIILGACGGMGRHVAKSISSFSEIGNLTIADLNLKDAELLASQLGPHIKGIKVDINDTESLLSILSHHDIVLNTVGPFFKFGYQVLQTSLEANCHYMDICDDWEPTEKMLELNNFAKEKNLLAILGLGASPGITNLLGRIAIDHLDMVHTIYTGWNLEEAQPESVSSQKETNAAMIHGIEQITGKIKIFKDSKFQMVNPLKKLEVSYPNIGNFSAFIFGHPEAITFPHHFKDLLNSVNLAHGNKSTIFVLKIIRKLINLKILTKKTAARFLEWLEKKETTKKHVQTNSLPEIYALAIGSKNGNEESVGVSLDGEPSRELTMGEATGYPLSLGLKMFLNNEISESGVIAPESKCINHKKLLMEIYESFGMKDAKIKIDKSW
ncbi:MAG: hypothetical protein CMD75_00230 [Gammaproteobacteria bacterium]|nr:hypothetical protein [Gammaproteobacteria bacterium]